MGSPWIKMRTDLAGDPHVARLARALSAWLADRCPLIVRTPAARHLIVGTLHATWALADQYTVDGRLDGYTAETLDDLIGIAGWAEALAAVGWLEIDGEAIVIARFAEHNGTSAKRRAMESQRKRSSRSVSAECPHDVRTECATEGEGDGETPNGVSPVRPVADDDVDMECVRVEARKLRDKVWSPRAKPKEQDRLLIYRLVILTQTGRLPEHLSREAIDATADAHPKNPGSYLTKTLSNICQANGTDWRALVAQVPRSMIPPRNGDGRP
jgi:hypothetical protein